MIGKSKKLTFNTIFNYIFISFLVLFALIPIIWMIMTSLKDRSDVFGVVLRFKPQFDSYKEIFSSNGKTIQRGIINSIKIAGINSLIIILVGSLAGYSLSRLRFKGRKIILYGILASRLMPPVVVILPVFLLVREMGLIDKISTVSILHATFNLPICIWLLKSFFDTIPIQLEEAAAIDGATRFVTAIRIIFPLARAGIATTALFSFVFSWNEFLFSLIFTQKNAVTAPIVLANATYGEAQIFWANMAALATIIMIPAIILAFVGQKYLVRGLTIGSSK